MFELRRYIPNGINIPTKPNTTPFADPKVLFIYYSNSEFVIIHALDTIVTFKKLKDSPRNKDFVYALV
jgi:hypothetical protein